MYKNNPKIDPEKTKTNVASENDGLDEKMTEATIRNPNVATKLPRSIQRASHSRKQTGRYLPPHNLRDKVIAVSIVRAIKANKVKNKAISFENSAK